MDYRKAGDKWEKPMSPDDPASKGIHSGRHWIELHSEEIARICEN